MKPKSLIKNVLGLLASVFIFSTLNAQVVLNEFTAANYTNFGLGGGWTPEYEDWVEFYNPTGAAINIGGYWLSDNPTDPQKYEIPAGTNVPANGYALILLSGTFEYDPGYLGQINSSFKVTQTNFESIVFSNPIGAILESYSFDPADADGVVPNQANHSWGRNGNGSADWVIHTSPTPEAANGTSAAVRYAANVQISVQAGYYAGAQNVALSTTEPGATIYYTLDGSEPDNTDNVYAGPINIASTQVIRAVAYSADATVLPGFVETNTYFIGPDTHTIMQVSISGATLSDGAWGGDELTHIEFFDENGTFLSEATGDSNEHGNDSNAYDQRGFDMIIRDALGYDNVIDYPLINTTDRPSYERLIFKAAANDNYSYANGAHLRDAYVHELALIGDLHVDGRKCEFSVLYINGAYWGVYDIREKVDDIDFTDYYYDQPEGFVDFIKTWGGTWDEYGSSADWNSFVNFVTTNDMTIQANYDYVLTQYNTMSLIDYFILNGYVVTTDWLNWNTAWWRGRYPQGDAKRWRYALWDNDATFGHYINYTGVPSTQPDADPCQTDAMGDVGGQGHIPVLNALFDNEQFFADYIQRYAALSNTIFSCDQMIHVLDSMALHIDPEMTRQCNRWGGTYAGWQANVQVVRDFILDRCNNEIIGGIEDCYDVTALTLTVEVDGVGDIEVGTVELNQTTAPWSGIFFADLAISLIAPEAACGTFAGWEITSGTGVIEDASNPNTSMTISTDVTVVAHFVASNGLATVVVNMEPSGAGVVQVNGADVTAYPTTFDFALGGLQTFNVSENEWYTFNHWETNFTELDPDDQATTVSFTSCLADTITAVFDAILHAELTVDVFPAGAGTITMGGTPLASYSYTEVLEADLDYYFITTPSDIWNVFDHWEINNHVLSPDEFNTNVVLHLMEDDTLVAVYNVIDHRLITVVVDPPYAGTVNYAGSYSTDTENTSDMETGVAFPFLASPAEYWNFKGWEGLASVPTPNSTDRNVSFTFTATDTVWAHFEKEPFTFYIPNSFSPNNDGINDVFLPVTNAIDPEYYHLMVFNRWGDKVFDTTDPNDAWEGDYKDGSYYLPDGIYMYRLEIKSVHEEDYRDLEGTIMIFR